MNCECPKKYRCHRFIKNHRNEYDVEINALIKESFENGKDWLTRHVGVPVKLCQLLSSGEYSFLRYDLPIRQAGIYFLLSLHRHAVREIIYIGESENILQRIGCHAGNIDFDYCGWFPVVGNSEQRRAVERMLIKKHGPRLNVRGRVRFERHHKKLDRLALHGEQRDQ